MGPKFKPDCKYHRKETRDWLYPGHFDAPIGWDMTMGVSTEGANDWHEYSWAFHVGMVSDLGFAKLHELK